MYMIYYIINDYTNHYNKTKQLLQINNKLIIFLNKKMYDRN